MEEQDRHDLVIVLTYYAPYVSGLTNVARDVAEGLAARGLRVCVVASKHDPSLPTHEVRGGVRVVRAPVLAKVGKGTIGLNLTRMALREMRRARVANLHLPLIEAGLLARVAPCPVVSTYHCDVSLPDGHLNRLQHHGVDLSSRVALRHSAAAVVSSEDYARHSRLWSAIRPGMVAIPPPCEPRSDGAPTYRDGDGFHVGFLGRIVEEKGVEHLVDAFLALDDPAARLLIGGDFTDVAGGSVVDRVRRHIADDDRIRLLGFVPDERLDDFYASLDAFALPSVNAFEAFGIVQVVAMMAGAPAVVSDLPGVRTVVERTGFGAVVAPRDVAGLTAALGRLRDEPPDAARGSETAARLFSVASVLDAYEAVFDKAADPQGAAHVRRAVDERARTGRGVDSGVDSGADGGIAEVSRTWTRLGAEDPMWAVLTDRGKGGTWEPGDFLDTGAREVSALLDRLDALGAPPVRGSAVDFGCGAGRLSHGLARAGFDRVEGLDISETMLAKAREIVPDAACTFRHVAGPALDGVPDASADLVYTCRVLQHMPTELAHRYVAAFYRIVRPGGLVVFQLPTTPARTAAGLLLRALPAPVARRLRRGMEMHGTPEAGVRALVAQHGAQVLAADPDTSAGPRWESRLYVTVAA